MSLTPLGLLAAFGAGMLSFLAPCVVPLVPGYLSFLAGTSLAVAPGHPGEPGVSATARWTVRRRVSLHALWFVASCTLVLMLLGAAAALLGSALSAYQQVLEHIGGLLLILFGVALTGLVPVAWLSWDHRVNVKPGRSVWWRSGLVGMAFGASWSACASPILGALLVLTAVRSLAVAQGVLVKLVFALGQGVPFLLVGILVDRAGPLLHHVRRYTHLFSVIGGVTLVLIGFFLLTGLFSGSQ
ncbi:MAG TPA: cytochrome c biogenesis protein CcdA [Ktedonobacterales bacterium]|nr:cytochrome c biogenesis protein CcdA [Ktedonobacterales bacterium]